MLATLNSQLALNTDPFLDVGDPLNQAPVRMRLDPAMIDSPLIRIYNTMREYSSKRCDTGPDRGCS